MYSPIILYFVQEWDRCFVLRFCPFILVTRIYKNIVNFFTFRSTCYILYVLIRRRIWIWWRNRWCCYLVLLVILVFVFVIRFLLHLEYVWKTCWFIFLCRTRTCFGRIRYWTGSATVGCRFTPSYSSCSLYSFYPLWFNSINVFRLKWKRKWFVRMLEFFPILLGSCFLFFTYPWSGTCLCIIYI